MFTLAVFVAGYFVGEFRAEVWAFLSKWAKAGWDKLNKTPPGPTTPPVA